VNVDPSSLIFVVIVGIWAVYLVQNWVRRREQVATSRSVDRFSEAMRVLERRAPIPVELTARPNRPYVVSPAPVQAPPQPAGRSVPTPEVAMKQTAPPRTVSPRPGRRPHRVRALVLLTLLVATPAVWGAHLFGTLLLWPTVTVTLLFVLDLLYVRAAVGRERIRRRRMVHGARPRPARRPAARPAAEVSPSRPARASRPAPAPAVATRPLAAPAAPTAAAPVHSQEAVTEVIVRDGEWQPIAVPRPTYAMKAKADRPRTGSAALVAESDSAPVRDPQPVVVLDELDLDAVLDRRRAAGA
jgi:hypothetical protein